ncbi:MAG: RluA family pseudouridine synthase [Ruminococcus sp.]|nr:RluA family pseudouridine synthase [Ruminococcus sp.]
MKLDILYEDADLIVCIKPAGVPTQSKEIRTPDMETLLKTHLRKSFPQAQVPYLAVIHRLDQPVEGILVFAKTPAAAKELNRQLTTSGFGKYYRALLSHIPEEQEADLEHFLVRDGRTNTSSVCTEDTPDAKKAKLHYKIIKTEGDQAVADIVLDTGRHHQIRVQMAAIDCPIVGDTKYGAAVSTPAASCANPFSSSSTLRRPVSRRESRRIELYACRLTFVHPTTKKNMTFEISRL